MPAYRVQLQADMERVKGIKSETHKEYRNDVSYEAATDAGNIDLLHGEGVRLCPERAAANRRNATSLLQGKGPWRYCKQGYGEENRVGGNVFPWVLFQYFLLFKVFAVGIAAVTPKLIGSRREQCLR